MRGVEEGGFGGAAVTTKHSGLIKRQFSVVGAIPCSISSGQMNGHASYWDATKARFGKKGTGTPVSYKKLGFCDSGICEPVR